MSTNNSSNKMVKDMLGWEFPPTQEHFGSVLASKLKKKNSQNHAKTLIQDLGCGMLPTLTTEKKWSLLFRTQGAFILNLTVILPFRNY